jgi:rRNA-processing protein FCF1
VHDQQVGLALGYLLELVKDLSTGINHATRIYIVATNDQALKRRLRKIPGVPLMSVARGKYVIERLPNAPE